MGRILYEEKVEPVSADLFPPIPADTGKAARAIFGRSNFYLMVGDQANHLFAGLQLAGPAGCPQKEERKLAILHLVTVFQFVETLPDLLARDSLRERVDWKYALHLPLHYPFREAASLCEFRQWLLAERARVANFQRLLERLAEASERARVKRIFPEAEQLVASVCRTSRLALIWDTMSQCLEALAIKRHDWLRVVSLPHWYDRYGHLSRDLNLRAECLEQETSAQGVGSDGFYLLEKISSSGLPELAELPEVRALRQLWPEQFDYSAGNVRWKEEACSSCSLASNHLLTINSIR